MGRPSILTRNAVPLIGMALAVLLIAGMWAEFRHVAAEMERTEYAGLTSHVRLQAELLSNHMEERRRDARLLAVHHSIISSVAGEVARDLIEAGSDIQNMRVSYGYAAIHVLGTDGMAILRTGPQPLAAAEDEAVRVALQSGAATLVDLHHHDGLIAYGVVEPIRAEGRHDQPVIGAVHLRRFAADDLYKALTFESAMHPNYDVFLVRQEGAAIRFLSPRAARPDLRPLDSSMNLNVVARQAVLDPGQVKEGVNAFEVPSIAVAALVGGTPWIVVVRMSAEPLRGPIRDLGLAAGSGTLGLLVLAGLIGMQQWRARTIALLQATRDLTADYDAAQASTMDGYFVIDDTGRFVHVNEEMCRISGYSVAELTRMTLADLDVTDDHAEVNRRLAALRLAGGGRFATQWRRPDESIIDVDVSIKYNTAGGGRFNGYMRDISAEVAARLKLDRLARFKTLLERVNDAIVRQEPAEKVQRLVCEQAVELLDLPLVWIGLEDRETRIVAPTIRTGRAVAYVEQLRISTAPDSPHGHGPSAISMRTGQPFIVNDFQAAGVTAPWHALAKAHGLHASASFRIDDGAGRIGGLAFYAGEAGLFNDEIVDLLGRLARNVSLALAQERQRQELLESEGRFRSLIEQSATGVAVFVEGHVVYANPTFATQVGRPLDEVLYANPDEWLTAQGQAQKPRDLAELDIWGRTAFSMDIWRPDGSVVTLRASAVKSLWEGKAANIALFQDETEVARARAELVQSEARFRALADQAPVGIVLSRHDRYLYANHALAAIYRVGGPQDLLRLRVFDTITEAERPRLEEYGRRRLAGEDAPTEYETMGQRPDGTTFPLRVRANKIMLDDGPASLAFLTDMTAAQEARNRIEAYARDLEVAIEGTLQVVAKMVDLRDPYTAGHERRVGLLSASLARDLGMDPHVCHGLELSGLVHDVGKMAVPVEILTKPGRLNELEMNLVRIHAQAGYDILKDAHFPWPVAEIARQHHERIDGSGYPRGLKGDEILREARIVAVADVVESMASHRPYRPSLGLEPALAELRAGRGSRYDAEVVDALLRQVAEGRFTLPA
jgi:PAS domain S-box-containing protein